jgi:phosphotriesterase-related protein
MAQLITTLGPKLVGELGMILPHEHVFVDLRTPDTPGQGEADADDVIRQIAPEIERARAAGITALVECTPVGVGRRIDILEAVSKALDFPLIVPTGIYREPWIPADKAALSEDALFDWMLAELTDRVEGTQTRAGWIKLSAGDDGLTATETRILRAAARAAKETNAVIGSHTLRGRVVRDQLAIIESVGYSPSRFIWIHTQAEPDFDLHLEMARRGVWVEYDWIGGDDQADAAYIDRIQRLIAAGLEAQLLISQDRGWYDPAQPGGGQPKPYTYLTDTFIPKLREAGTSDEIIRQLTHINPFNAFAR